MPAKVWIPPQLRAATDGHEHVAAKGETAGEVLADVVRQFPGLRERVLDEHGTVRPFLNVYLNDEDIRFLKGDASPVKDGDELLLIPEVGGG